MEKFLKVLLSIVLAVAILTIAMKGIVALGFIAIVLLTLGIPIGLIALIAYGIYKKVK